MSKKIFPDVLADLKAATSEELAESLASYEGLLLKVKDRDPEVLGDLDIAGEGGALEQAREALAYRTQLNEEIAARAAVEETFEAEMAEMTEGIAAPAVEEALEADEVEAAEVVAEAEAATAEASEEVAVEVEPEPVVASVKAAKPRPPAPTKAHAPLPEAEESLTRKVGLVASSGIPGVSQGETLDRESLRSAMTEAYSQGTTMHREKVVVARADWRGAYPENRQLTEGLTASAIRDALESVIGPQALLASGGLCAPVTPYYELMTVATAARPVRDALASFQAVRGGLQFGSPLNLADVAAGVGVKTEAEDAQGGTFALKDCLFVECPDFSTVTLNMIYRCLQFGNLNSRAFPEMVNQAIELAIAYHARVAEAQLLDYIGDNSTHTTQALQYGATSTLIDSLLYAAAGMRSRNRMSIDSRFRVLLPAWARELLATDVVNSQFMRFDVKPGDVDGLLRSYGVEPTWYLDSESGLTNDQVFGTQSAGALLDFPNTLQAYIFPEGSFLFLDGGTLDLGVVRDSTLNSTNDFEVFAETFEAAAYVGVESLRIQAIVCPSGAVAAPSTAITCS